MTTDLYKILGVRRRSASPRNVQRAFRRKALATHPDRGGSAEEFQAVQLAYAVLSDPERRRRYDETGVVEPPRPDNSAAELAGVLDNLFARAVAAIPPSAMGKQDVVGWMLRTLRAEEGQNRLAIESNDRADASLVDAAGRLTDPLGLLAGAIALRRQTLAQNRQQLTRNLDLIGRTIKYLEGCKYRHDPVPDGYVTTAPATRVFVLGTV